MANLSRLLHETITAEAARLRVNLFNAAWSLLLLGIAVVLALIGMTLFSVGIYRSLAEVLPEWLAGGVTAVVVLIMAGFFFFLSRQRMLPSRRAPPPLQSTISSVAKDLKQTADRGIAAGETLSGKGMRPVDLALAAFVAGLIVSRRLGPRRQTQQPRSNTAT